jgi:hypothetical protein
VSGQLHSPRTFYPRGNSPRNPLIGDWVGPKAGLDAVEKRKISCPCRESDPGRPAVSPSLYRLSYSGSLCYFGSECKLNFITEGSSFRNAAFFSFQNIGRWTKSKNPVIQSIPALSEETDVNHDEPRPRQPTGRKHIDKTNNGGLTATRTNSFINRLTTYLGSDRQSSGDS